jgi:hypothetical protein
MLDRGLLAPLSPHEEVKLRRVALGIANPAEHADQDLERLKALLMIEEYRAGSRLTPTGKKRYLGLPNRKSSTEAHRAKEWQRAPRHSRLGCQK